MNHTVRKIIRDLGLKNEFARVMVLRSPFDFLSAVLNANMLESFIRIMERGEGESLSNAFWKFLIFSMLLFGYNATIWATISIKTDMMFHKRLRLRLMDSMLSRTEQEMDRLSAGDWITRLNMDVDKTADYITCPFNFMHAMIASVNLILSSVILVFLNPKLFTVTVLVMIPFFILSSFVIIRKIPYYRRKAQESQAEYTNWMEPIVDAGDAITIFDGEEIVLREVEEKSLNITLLLGEEVTNLKYMFYDCIDLKSIKFISTLITKKSIDMSYMFYKCESLDSLNDISEWISTNVRKLSFIFYGCKSLKKLPDISKWNTSKVTDMNSIFYGCSLLEELPDISKWNTSKVTDMSYMFYECASLKELPDISKWDTINVTDMSYMLYGCASLKELPDISKWNTINVTDMSYMFYGCESLIKLHDFSKWNKSSVKNMSNMLRNCGKLKKIKGIFKSVTSKLENISSMFYGCSSLEKLPDISNLKKEKLKDFSNLFGNCNSLKENPNGILNN